MNSPAVATDALDGLQLVWAGVPSAYLPEQVYSYLDGLQLVRAGSKQLSYGHERGDPNVKTISHRYHGLSATPGDLR